MSSKSKKPGRKGGSGSQHGAHEGQGHVEAVHPAAHGTKLGPVDIPDEIVHVPRNTSPLRFVLMIALIILLLIIFLVPDALQGTFGRGDPDVPYVGWKGPDGVETELGFVEFRNEKRLLVTALEVDPFLAGVLGADGRNLSDEQLARFLILDQLAVAGGLHVPDADLVEHLRQLSQLWGGVANYKAMVQRTGSSHQDVEESIRRILRASRYLQVSALLAGLPDPASIEQAWNTEHEELSFDFAWSAFADLHDDAHTELPDDEALAAWFEALEPERKAEFQEPERRSAEVVSFTDPAATPATGLLAAFPETTPEGEEPVTPEERTQQYYDQVYFWHFLAPAELDAQGEPLPPSYVPFEEAREQATLEAPVYFAMQRWLAALRESETTVDLATLAAEHGLAYEALPLATRDAYRDREPSRNVGDTFATRVFQTNAGDFAYSVVARSASLSIVRTTEIVPASTRPFAEVREAVASLWVAERTEQLTLERFETLRASFPSEPPSGEAKHEEVEGQEHDHRYATAEVFRNSAAAARAAVGTRAWLDRGAQLVPTDPALDPATNAFFRTQRQLGGLSDDEVAAPMVDAASQRVYLVRLAGRRPVPLERMSPEALESRYRPQAAIERRRALLAEPSVEYLEREFGLWFARSEEEELEAEEPTEG